MRGIKRPYSTSWFARLTLAIEFGTLDTTDPLVYKLKTNKIAYLNSY